MVETASLLAQTIDLNFVDWIAKLGPTGLLAGAVVVLWRENRRLTTRLDGIMDGLLPLINTQNRVMKNVSKVVGADDGNGAK